MLPDALLLARPHPDELLYSAIARCHSYLASASPKALVGALFTDRNLLAVPDLPSGLHRLKWLYDARWGLSDDELLRQHTHLPFWVRFRSRREADALQTSLLSGSVQGLHVRLGLCASAVRPVTHFRFCGQCVLEDERSLGFTYWRTLHQVPGVLVCTKHGIALSDADVSFRPRSRNEFIPATPDLLARSRAVEVDASRVGALLELAREIEIVTRHVGQLAAYPKPARRDASRMRESLRVRLGDDVLHLLFRGGADPLQWVGRAPRSGNRHPLQEVMLRFVAEESTPPARKPAAKTWGLYRDTQLRARALEVSTSARSTRALARALGVDWKTAARLVAPLPTPAPTEDRVRRVERDIAEWQALRDRHRSATTKSVRALVPALYARLYRNARHVLAGAPRTSMRTRPTLPRRDWPARDALWRDKIASAADELRRAVPQVRVSRHRVLALLGARSLFAHYAHRLPAAGAMLATCCESVAAFQERRLRRAMLLHGDRPAWALLRLANIHPGRESSARVIARLHVLRQPVDERRHA